MIKEMKNMPVDIVVMMKGIKPAHDDKYNYDFLNSFCRTRLVSTFTLFHFPEMD
jgi:hypothetical protein